MDLFVTVNVATFKNIPCILISPVNINIKKGPTLLKRSCSSDFLICCLDLSQE
jgi:hypothetical protein